LVEPHFRAGVPSPLLSRKCSRRYTGSAFIWATAFIRSTQLGAVV
jgi:hypothetical protein